MDSYGYSFERGYNLRYSPQCRDHILYRRYEPNKFYYAVSISGRKSGAYCAVYVCESGPIRIGWRGSNQQFHKCSANSG
jgi:hypothetical protein